MRLRSIVANAALGAALFASSSAFAEAVRLSCTVNLYGTSNITGPERTSGGQWELTVDEAENRVELLNAPVGWRIFWPGGSIEDLRGPATGVSFGEEAIAFCAVPTCGEALAVTGGNQTVSQASLNRRTGILEMRLRMEMTGSANRGSWMETQYSGRCTRAPDRQF
jgi:hypothetical protein